MALLAVAVVAGACGDSGESGDGPSDSVGTVSSVPAPTTQPAGDTSGCDPIAFRGSVARSASGSHAEVMRSDGEMRDAVAAVRSEGVAYTIYVADFMIDNDDVGGTLIAPPGSVMVTIAIDELDGIVVGQVFDNTEEAVPFVIIDSGGGATDSSSGASGEITVTGLSATNICFDIEYTDNVKSLSASVSAEIVPAF